MKREKLKPHGLSRSLRIRNKKDHEANRLRGRKIHTEHFIIKYSNNDVGVTRIGLGISRRVGNAVVRNRIRRLIREFFRQNREAFPQGIDLVVIAKPVWRDLSFHQVSDEFKNVIRGVERINPG
ncbi:MAG: ribonuclease P protein component [Deltaproteobacteria bacterium]|nr:ribonuclease P protein component [Deltaproteobacteria bacterium]MBF0509644.1 ribonuclease P protein component [Deltaproteobacteria bacterium]